MKHLSLATRNPALVITSGLSLFVLVLAPKVFSGFFDFPPSTKTKFLNSNLIRNPRDIRFLNNFPRVKSYLIVVGYNSTVNT